MQDRWNSRRAASRGFAGGMLILALAVISACGQANTTGRSATYLVIDSLQAASGAKPDTFSTTLKSDVVTKGSIYEDPGKVTMHIALKDATATITPTSINAVTVTRYHVSFRRTDGRNTQGVDVPYAFDGGATGTFDSSGGSLVFVIVRGQAKLESPLMSLRDQGGSIIISTLADVTFYGQDQNGSAISVTGTISVNFADWADPA